MIIIIKTSQRNSLQHGVRIGFLPATDYTKVFDCVDNIDYAKSFDCVDHNKLWEILKEMGILDHLTCLLRNLYGGQEATVRTGHRTTA